MHDFNIKNMYVDKLDEVVNRYNNIYHSTIRMKPVDVKSNKRINSGFDNKDVRFKIRDNVRISKYNNIFAKGSAPNWSEEVFLIKKS